MAQIRVLAPLAVLVGASMALAACGSPRAPDYGSGVYEGGPASTTSTTTPSGPSSGTSNSPTVVASKFTAINWSANPSWPSGNYVYTLDRPYLTAAVNAQYAAINAKPIPASINATWAQDQRFKIGAAVDVTASFVVQDAGVTPTTCIVEVNFIVDVTNDGVIQGATGQSYEYAFQMKKLGGRWLVASQPQEPE